VYSEASLSGELEVINASGTTSLSLSAYLGANNLQEVAALANLDAGPLDPGYGTTVDTITFTGATVTYNDDGSVGVVMASDYDDSFANLLDNMTDYGWTAYLTNGDISMPTARTFSLSD
ncbi:hypothetical protein Q4595_22055, partial [Wenyingzhuangia sp. 1_MG-2023]|nr:hypothetical protein [Wenyingzhuangia sp. 1_MG-2023]